MCINCNGMGSEILLEYEREGERFNLTLCSTDDKLYGREAEPKYVEALKTAMAHLGVVVNDVKKVERSHISL